MCIFTGPVRSVSNTKIFGRCDGERQVLAYAMRATFDREMAMVLPLPVVPGAREDAVRFVDLSARPELFDDLDGLFPPELTMGFGPAPRAAAPQPLAVIEVGSFVASFVPTVADFDRLDPRFRLATAVWAALPQLATFGFAVFKLKPGAQRVHPMGLDFPTRDPSTVFFPCVHVHDGVVHPQAPFDHTLYCQAKSEASAPRGPHRWESSLWPPTEEMVRTSEALLAMRRVFRTSLRGMLENADVLAAV